MLHVYTQPDADGNLFLRIELCTNYKAMQPLLAEINGDVNNIVATKFLPMANKLPKVQHWKRLLAQRAEIVTAPIALREELAQVEADRQSLGFGTSAEIIDRLVELRKKKEALEQRIEDVELAAKEYATHLANAKTEAETELRFAALRFRNEEQNAALSKGAVARQQMDTLGIPELMKQWWRYRLYDFGDAVTSAVQQVMETNGN
jgi:hypothetical protein